MGEAELAKYFLTKKVPYVKPLYSINVSDKEKILDWFREANYTLGEYYVPLFREQRDNLAYFLGAGVNPHFATPFAATFATTSDLYAEPQQVFINELYRLTMAQISLVVNNELVPDVLPNSDDYSDKVACNVVKQWLDSTCYTLGMEAWRFKLELQKKMYGEAFAIVAWDPEAGDIHPDVKERYDEEFVFRDEQGMPILDVEGKEMKIKKNMRVGDLKLINPMPWETFIDPKEHYEDADWFYWKEYLDVEYLKKKYPKLNWDQGAVEKRFDAYSGTEKDDENRRVIYYLFHKSHPFMPEGRYIVCSKEHVLINKPLYLPTLINNQTLPLVRFCEMDVGCGVRGVPVLFRNVKSLADAYNRVTNQIYNNLEMESPKIFVHEDAGVDAQRMPNGISAVEWRGNHKPTIETPPSNTSSIFNFREAIKRDADEMALQNPLVRGDTPNAQLDSFVSLQYFEDLRVQLASSDIKSHIRSMEQLFRLLIIQARDNYEPGDQRLMKILGKHNTAQLKFFDPINLQKTYDVTITTTGNLAHSKAARTQMMISIKREFPNVLSDEVFMDALGLSHSKKFMNAITAAVSAAEAENETMFDGDEVPSPTRYEDLIAHWETHRIPMQTLDFKMSPPEIQALFIGHVAATEKLMTEQAAESETFQARLEGLRQFPMFYMPIPVNELAPAEMMAEEEELSQPTIPEQVPEANIPVEELAAR
jgi:hypothetical protein